MVDYNILSPHYNENLVPASSISRSIAPKFNISGQTHNAPTVGSYRHFEGMPPIAFEKPDGQMFVKHITTGNPNRWAVPIDNVYKYGPYSPQEDDVHGFGTWKDACEQNQAREYVVYPQKSSRYGLIESFSERKLKLPEGSTPVELFVHDTEYAGSINNFGRLLHVERNLKQHLMEHYRLGSSQEFVKFLKSRGMELEEIGYLAAGFLPKNTKYAVGRASDGKVIFFSAEDAYDHIVNDARFFGTDAEDDMNRTIREELVHIARKSYDRIAHGKNRIHEEEDTKAMVRDFYLQRAEGAEGNPQLVRHYLKQAAIMEWDRATTRKRYSKIVYHDEDLEGIVEHDEHANHQEGRISDLAYQTANGKRIYMPTRATVRGENKKVYGEETQGKVVYGRFGKLPYQGRGNEDDTSKGDARKSASAKAAPKPSAEARETSAQETSAGEPGAAADGEATAEAA